MADVTPPITADPPDDATLDVVLMRRIAGGEEAALAELYDRWSARLNGLVVRILNDRTDAEELLTEIFYEVWNRADRYDASRGCVATYLLTLTRSRAIDRRRRKTARPDADASRSRPVEADDATTGDLAGSPLGGVLFEEQAAAVRRALASLEAPQRDAIELAYFEGLSQSEVAHRMSRPLGTVKTWIRQGLLRLREAVEGDLR